MIGRVATAAAASGRDQMATSMRRACRRQLSSDTATSGRPTISMPSSQTSKSWERSAKLVKNTDVNNEYLDAIRQTHDPAMHLKTIEDELRGTMGKALGNQGEKILRFVRAMAQERQRYDELLEKGGTELNPKDVTKTAERYNELRKEAIKARWELLVHRQAVGFIVDNHNTVSRHFPIGGPLPFSNDDGPGEPSGKGNRDGDQDRNGKDGSIKNKFGTQTDWWQRIGRWR